MDIKDIRKNLNLSQTAFGEIFGIPMRTLQNWELGIRKPPDYVINLMKMNLELQSKVKDLEQKLNDRAE